MGCNDLNIKNKTIKISNFYQILHIPDTLDIHIICMLCTVSRDQLVSRKK